MEEKLTLIDLFVLDKGTGIVHKIGDDPHDSLWVDEDGTVNYYNLKTGDGCGANSKHTNSGYEFVTKDVY